ncbi:helix-turn-helix domain-containing protein [Bosea sp. 124]|uniref:helix-turn-helix domain-containing protein n=1 Tax=Bosea sp. 124 TaxID=2135642 RepID=UPI000D34A551|nr:helix-turn-helix domain-containing protein [Bosea sp. 124]PTM41588.1 hypothetical protein C8D03_3152 [Bosea sp. 124]
MLAKIKMTGRLVKVARSLAGISTEDFAKAAGLTVQWLGLIEANGGAWVSSERDAAALHGACEHFVVVVLDERDGMGAGVRLKFSRQDVKQLLQLEDEGGISSLDDNP